MAGERERVAETAKSIGNLNDNVHQVLTLGLLTYRKWDRAIVKHNKPSLIEVAEFDSFTPDEIIQLKEAASNLLKRYGVDIATTQKHPMTWGEWWWGVLQGFVAALIYSVFLIGVAILGSKFAGHDLLEILREALRP